MGLQPPSFPEKGETEVQPWELGGLVGAGLADRSPLSPLELYPALNLSVRGNKLSHRHGVQGCCSAARGWLWQKQTLGHFLPLVIGF